MEELKSAVASDDLDQIKEKNEALQKAAYKLAEEMYKAGAAEGAGAQPDGSAAGGEDTSSTKKKDSDNVEDADYEVVD